MSLQIWHCNMLWHSAYILSVLVTLIVTTTGLSVIIETVYVIDFLDERHHNCWDHYSRSCPCAFEFTLLIVFLHNHTLSNILDCLENCACNKEEPNKTFLQENYWDTCGISCPCIYCTFGHVYSGASCIYTPLQAEHHIWSDFQPDWCLSCLLSSSALSV